MTAQRPAAISAVVILGQRTITVHPAIDDPVWPGHVWSLEPITLATGQRRYRAHHPVHGASQLMATTCGLAVHVAVHYHGADHEGLDIRRTGPSVPVLGSPAHTLHEADHTTDDGLIYRVWADILVDERWRSLSMSQPFPNPDAAHNWAQQLLTTYRVASEHIED